MKERKTGQRNERKKQFEGKKERLKERKKG